MRSNDLYDTLTEKEQESFRQYNFERIMALDNLCEEMNLDNEDLLKLILSDYDCLAEVVYILKDEYEKKKNK